MKFQKILRLLHLFEEQCSLCFTLFFQRGSAGSNEFIGQKKKGSKECQPIDNMPNFQMKNFLGAGSSNESLGNPTQTHCK